MRIDKQRWETLSLSSLRASLTEEDKVRESEIRPRCVIAETEGCTAVCLLDFLFLLAQIHLHTEVSHVSLEHVSFPPENIFLGCFVLFCFGFYATPFPKSFWALGNKKRNKLTEGLLFYFWGPELKAFLYSRTTHVSNDILTLSLFCFRCVLVDPLKIKWLHSCKTTVIVLSEKTSNLHADRNLYG